MADEQTPEQIAAAEAAQAQADELARLRALAQRFQPLEAFADALEQDPSKIYAMQAALNGQPQAQPQQQAPQQQPQHQLSQQEIQELNARALQNPAEFMAQVAQQAVRQGLGQFAAEASPYMTTTADLFIETFKNQKASTDTLYKQILPYFDREISDINRQALLGRPAAERARDLELRWQSAASAVFRKAAATVQTQHAPNLGGGGAGGGNKNQDTPKKTAFERDVTVSALTQNLIDQGLISKEDIAEMDLAITAENE